MRKTLATAALVLLMPVAAWAMGDSNNTPAPAAKASYSDGYDKAMAGEYSAAIEILKDVVSDDAKNADAWNMLGYSYRNIGDTDNAWDAYERALAIAPDHKGAHEYLGEWYLMQGDKASAAAQLTKLKALCPSGCKEAETLEAAIKKAESNS